MNKKMLVMSAGLLALVVFALGAFFYTQQQTRQAGSWLRKTAQPWSGLILLPLATPVPR